MFNYIIQIKRALASCFWPLLIFTQQNKGCCKAYQLPQTSNQLKNEDYETKENNLLVTEGSLLELKVTNSNQASVFQAMPQHETGSLFPNSVSTK